VNTCQGFFESSQSGTGSWYRASARQDSNSGRSWCAHTYYNSYPVFAMVCTGTRKARDYEHLLTIVPKVYQAMGGKTYNNDTAGWKAATQYCGIEATLKDPKTGKQMLIYIVHAFDDDTFLWVFPVPTVQCPRHTDGTLVIGFHRHHDRRVLQHPQQSQRQQERRDKRSRVAIHQRRQYEVCCKWRELADQSRSRTCFNPNDDAIICFVETNYLSIYRR
jgi:hypothetical protein